MPHIPAIAHTSFYVCFQEGEIKIRIGLHQQICLLLQAFKRQLIAQGRDKGLPSNDSNFKVEFDGDRLDQQATVESVGIEEGDKVDVWWN